MKIFNKSYLFVYLAFFLSGISYLVAEIAFNRMLILAVGNTVLATSMIVMVFMGGLCLGSFLGGTFLKAKQPSILFFAVFELCIGFYIFLFPHLFSAVSHGLLGILSSYNQTSFLTAFRIFLVACLLLIPTVLMGATYPAIIHPLSKKEASVSHAGYLYSFNTIGAAMGCLLAGYVLIPFLGYQGALFFAFVMSLLSAGCAFVFLESEKELSFGDETKEDVPKKLSFFLKERSFLVISFIIFAVGFIFLSYEVLLVRMVILLIGNIGPIFPLIVMAFLLASGISALVATWAHSRIKQVENLFSVAILLGGLFICLSPLILLMCFKTNLIQHIHRNFYEPFILFIIVIPLLFIGGLFPLAIKIFEDKGKENITKNASALYAINTLGGVLGAGLTNEFLVPFLGTQGVLRLFSVLFIFLGIIFVWHYFVWKKRIVWTIVFGMFIFLMVRLPDKTETIYVSSLMPEAVIETDPKAKFFYEGKSATITILDVLDDGRLLFLNGVEEVSTRFYHVQLFKMLGMFPLLMHPSDVPQDVLMIAFGAGLSSGAALDTGRVRSLDVVDLVPEAEKINGYFKEINNDVFHNPRFHFIPEDGRNYLLLTKKKYAAIICDATHPFAYDSWTLYTKEFYQQVKDHLTKDGIFVQWLPLSVQDEYFRIFLKTITKVFPHCTFWNIYGSDQGFIMAMQKPFRFDLKKIQSRLDHVSPSARLKEYQMDTAAYLAGFFVMGEDAIRRITDAEYRINTDNLPYNEKFAKQESLKKKNAYVTLDQYQTDIIPFLVNASDQEKRRIQRLQVLANAMRRFQGFFDIKALREAYEIDPENKTVLYFRGDMFLFYPQLSREFEVQTQRYIQQIRAQVERLNKKIDEGSQDIHDYTDLARLFINAGQIDWAGSLLNKAIVLSPYSIDVQKMKGIVAMRQGRYKEAQKMYRYVLDHRPHNFSVMMNLIDAYAETSDFLEQIKLLEDFSFDDSVWTGKMRYQYHELLAKSYYALKDYENCETQALKSLEYYPSNVTAKSMLANVYRHTHRDLKSAAKLKEILEINPFNTWALENLIVLTQEYGSDQEARMLVESLNRLKRTKK